RRLIHAQEEERRRLARDIHDDLGNRIALLSFSLRRMVKEQSKRLSSTTRELSKIQDGLTELSAALRDLSHGLHPAPLRYLGIPAALQCLREGLEDSRGVHIDLVVPSSMPRLADEVELCIFRIAQESLRNAIKHSGSGTVRMSLEYTSKQVRLTVADSGRGFNRSDALRDGGIGLTSMEERALSIGGTL